MFVRENEGERILNVADPADPQPGSRDARRVLVVTFPARQTVVGSTRAARDRTADRSHTRPTEDSECRDRANAVLVCHALTGDQHVANVHPVTGKPGWWVDNDRARAARSTRTASSSSARTSSADASARRDRPRPTPGPARPYGLDLPVDHDPRHGAGPGDARRRISASTRCSASSAAPWAACRCCNGRRPITGTRLQPRCRSRRRRAIPRRISPSMRWAGRP